MIGRGVEPAVERLRPDLGRRRGLRDLRAGRSSTRGSAAPPSTQNGSCRLACELREQVGDELLVLAASRTRRRAGSATSRRCRSAGRAPAPSRRARCGEVRRPGVVRRLRVLEEREDRLQLRVQHDLPVEAVEADPRAARQREEERRHGGVRAHGGGAEARVPSSADARASACAATACAIPDAHGGRPPAKRNWYSQSSRPPRGIARASERVGERPRRVDVALRGRVVQSAEVRERMELEPETREPAVDDAFVVGDVDAHGGKSVRLEVVEVRLELGEERTRARRDVRVRERRQLRELRRDHVRRAASADVLMSRSARVTAVR